MKKRNITLFTLLGTLALSASITFALNNKQEYKEASATIKNLTSGTFARVTDASQIFQGGNYIFVADNGYALSDVWGNPGYVYGQPDGVSFSDKGLVTLSNSPASIFGVEVVDGKFAFHTTMEATGQTISKAYLAHNDTSWKDGFTAIGYFYGDRTGITTKRDFKNEDQNENSAYWSFRYDEEHGNYITNLGYGGDLGFTSYYAPHFCRGGEHRVEIYRECSTLDGSISVSEDPEITEYSNGDEINLSGLVITFGSSYHNATYSYNKYPHLFSCEKYASGSGERYLPITFMNTFVTNEVEITVNRAEYYASQVTSPLADYRGQYMLVSDDVGRVLGGTDINSIINVEPGPNGKYKVDHGVENEVKFVIEKTNGNFYLKNSLGKYLSFSGGINYTDSKSFPVILVYDQGGVRIKGSDQEGLYLNLNLDDYTYKFCLGGKNTANQEPVFLYKYDYTNTVVDQLDDFANGFISATMVCDALGLTNNIINDIWSAQASAFAGLDPFAQAELINKSYTHGSTDGDVVAQAVERYDYIINKYTTSTFSDFIGRIANGTIQHLNSEIAINTIYNNNVDTTNVIIICVVSFLGIVLIYSLFRLKKEHSR